MTVAGVSDVDRLGGAMPPDEAITRLDESDGQALVLLQNGQITAEYYAGGVTPETRFNSFSMVKSLVGLLTLRAIETGVLPSRDTSVQGVLGLDAPDVSLAELLTMTGGIAATNKSSKSDTDEGYSPFTTLAALHVFGPDRVVRKLRLRSDWHGSFHYQSANTALLGRALEVAYGHALSDILSEQIWRPAGAADAHWRRYPKGAGVAAYCCLYARPIDWARVGAYVLSNGTPDAPFLSVETWQKAVRPELHKADRRLGVYGDHIRHDVLDRPGERASGPFAYFMGHGGQVLYLLPSQNAVVVRFGKRPQLLHSTLYDLFP